MRLYRDAIWLRQKYWDEGLTAPEMGALIDVCDATILYWMIKYGIARRTSGTSRRGEKHPNWKGGRKYRTGYILAYARGHPHAQGAGYILEHRLVMEESLGRYLESWEIVHHKNGIRDDNRIENLELLPQHSHHLALQKALIEIKAQKDKMRMWQEAYFQLLTQAERMWWGGGMRCR